MKKLFKIVLVIILPILPLILPAVIYFLFTSAGNLEKTDWLTFLGAYLSFMGSVILGMVTVFQNIKQRKDNEKSEERMAELAKQANDIAQKQIMLEYIPKIIFYENCNIKFSLSRNKIDNLKKTLKINAYNINKEELGSTSNQINLVVNFRKINHSVITGIGLSNIRITRNKKSEIKLDSSEEYICLIENNKKHEIIISLFLQNIYDVIKTNIQENKIINGFIQICANLKMKNIYGNISETPLTMLISWQMDSEKYENNNLYNKSFIGQLNVIYESEKNNVQIKDEK